MSTSEKILSAAQAGSGQSGGLLRALRHRNYRLFFAGQGISLVGTWMQTMAQAWLVYRLSGSSLALGLVGFAGQIPVFLLAVFGGVVADARNRRAIMLWTQALSMLLALAAAALTLSGVVQVWHVMLLAVGLGVVNAFDIPARQAFVIDMVGRQDLHNAIALNSSMFNSARVLGPTLAGLLVPLVGEGWCFLLNGASYLAVMASLLLMRLPPDAPKPTGASAWRRVGDGLTFAAHHTAIRTVLLLTGLSSLLGTSYATLMPVFADRILGGGPGALGLLMGAAGLGAFGGAMLLAARRDSLGLGRWIIRAGVGFGLSLAVFSLSRQLWLSAALLAPVGFCMVVMMASANTLLQQTTPDGYRGRVMALFSIMVVGMSPFGALLAGALAHLIGPQLTVLAGGLACVAAAAGFRPGLTRCVAQ
ncbi:MFS transporter [Desulfocurvibacter africanus]|uniref:MFS transporter n=1 Tax=Desulfocurvibacter africanus TaxID=873 RepID=UPI000406AA05|nr:MFS transporter [Desulfocurvibacter africanus]